MDKLFDEFLSLIKEDKDLINELLVIDNDINSSNITYNELYNAIEKMLSTDNKMLLKGDTLFVTEGNPLITIGILKNIVNYFDYKYFIYINERYIGINEYLVKTFKSLTGNSINITLDTDINYNKYIGKDINVLPIGEKELIDEVLADFDV